MEDFLRLIGQGLFAGAGMFWSILWALILGFFLSGIIMAFVSKKRMVGLLGKPGPKELALAVFFGAISSSCSYAASSMTKSLFQKGAHIIPALAFLLASTNLVVELSLVLWLLMGWQFLAAEFIGGIILVIIMAGMMRLIGPLDEFKKHQQKLSNEKSGAAPSEAADPKTLEGWRRAIQFSYKEWRMIWKDVALGSIISGFLMVFVPDEVWRSLFMQAESGSLLKIVENAFVGPLVSVVSFVCSVGNIPLASVLYHGGIGFGGTISFIFADLIIIPLILVYRKYFGWKLALWITGIFYLSMALAGIIVELLFRWLDWIPRADTIMAMKHERFFDYNYTFVLNILFIVIGFASYRLTRDRSPAKVDHCCH